MTFRPTLLCFLLLSISACGQVDFSQYPYLLRLERENSDVHLCVLLQKSGAFHMESEGGSTKIFEGVLPEENLREVQTRLNDAALMSLSQKQINEPLLRSRDLLQLNIFRSDHWQDLIFHSAESEEPYRQSLEPLLRWLENLHKLPHKEFSEDAGKNNCLPPRRIVLKQREPASVMPAEPSPVPIPRTRQPAQPPMKPAPVPTLLRMLSMKKTSGTAEQRCVLVIANGAYRTELLVQKVGSKKVETKIDGGQMTPDELTELQRNLNDPALSRIRHRETSRAVLPMSGEMLELEINRESGIQDVVLSSTFNHGDVPFFYAGDGDISSVTSLLKFLLEHVENNQMGGLDPHLRNDCTEAP